MRETEAAVFTSRQGLPYPVWRAHADKAFGRLLALVRGAHGLANDVDDAARDALDQLQVERPVEIQLSKVTAAGGGGWGHALESSRMHASGSAVLLRHR